jgi:hypothetical protein
VFLPADIDRRFGRDNLPDHGDLLANLVRWAAKDPLPLSVEGPGLIDCHLYRQQDRLILHLVNLTNPGTWRQPVQELIPIGPLRVKVRWQGGGQDVRVRFLVNENQMTIRPAAGSATFEVKSVLDHEVVVIS